MLLNACAGGGQGQEDADSSPSTTTTTATANASSSAAPTTPSPTETAKPVPPLGSPDLQDKQQVPSGMNDMSITGIRVAGHEGFTRVVVDVAGSGTPGWWTTYTDEPLQQASGLPVDVAGESFLDIGIEGIAYPDDALEPGMDIGNLPGSGIVEEVALTSIFEARAQVVIGITGTPADYSVTLLKDPTRVVIDIVDRRG